MKSKIIKLEFLTPLHYGNSGKPGLLDSGITVCSDTIYSAICDQQPAIIDQLKSWVSEHKLRISDALPYVKERLLIPRLSGFQPMNSTSFEPGMHKKIKRMTFIPLDNCRALYQDATMARIDEAWMLEKAIGSFGIRTQASIPRHMEEDTTPYQIAEFTFNPGSGLYLWVKYDEETTFEQFKAWIINLGLQGLGGKRSSGLGKFKIQAIVDEPEESTNGQYLLLSTALPLNLKDDIYFNVIKRSGFYHSEDGLFKKRNVYAIKSGLLVNEPFEGVILDNLSKNHVIYRFLVPLFVRIDL